MQRDLIPISNFVSICVGVCVFFFVFEVKINISGHHGHIVVISNLGMPPFQKSAVFLNIVQKAFDPPPLLFEHLSYFAGGVF